MSEDELDIAADLIMDKIERAFTEDCKPDIDLGECVPKCTVDQCGKVPIADVQWGTDATPSMEYTFCQDHMDEFWERINPMLQANLAWFRMDAPGKIKEVK